MGTVVTGNHEEYGWRGCSGTVLTGKQICQAVYGAVFKELGEVDGASSPLVILSVGLQWLGINSGKFGSTNWDFSDSKSLVMWVEQLINHPPVITTNRWYKPFTVMDGLWLFYPHNRCFVVDFRALAPPISVLIWLRWQSHDVVGIDAHHCRVKDQEKIWLVSKNNIQKDQKTITLW